MFNNFLNDMGAALDQLSDAVDQVFGNLKPEVLDQSELDFLNNYDVKDLQTKVETVILGLHKDPMKACCTSTGITTHDEMKRTKVIPKHHMIVQTKTVEISAKLDPSMNPNYYMSSALEVKPRSYGYQRFDCNGIVFMNGELQRVQYVPGSSEFTISLQTLAPGGNVILDVKAKTFSYAVPKTQEELDALVLETGIKSEYFQFFMDNENKRYGRSKMPKFFVTFNLIDINPLYNVYQ